MTRQLLSLLLMPAIVAGCVSTGSSGTEPAPLPPLPESVIAVAAPWQNLATARLMPEDGCYWYTHEGQVETTMLPLRTPEGRPICTAAG